MNYNKYKRFETVKLTNRTWPNNEITKAPIWCSVDLRDGNQSLITPMTIDQKVRLFLKLVEIGFKEIEVGFPSASQIEFDFLRKLIDDNLIPNDVTVQVLTQAREHLIRRTFEALKGLDKAILHIYNSTSILQRDVVFNKSREEVKQIAIEGVLLVKELSNEFDGEILLEYSPESFTGTEMDYAVEVCDAVMDAWEATSDKKVIINLPSTVEMNTPNVYADQIEYCCNNFKDRSRVIVSLHPHNDRGCGVASTELGLLAGANRVEGTLFGNGERTGNADIVNIGLNMFVTGVDPKLDFSNINSLKEIYEDVTKLVVPDRWPYVGKLVFTAFSGSHQDAINKGIKAYNERNTGIWEVPYLPIDPDDLGRRYEPLVRINSQSGKGGIAYVMEQNFGFRLPKIFQEDFSKIVQKYSEEHGELTPSEVLNLFMDNYLNVYTSCYFVKHVINDLSNERHRSLTINYEGEQMTIEGHGEGPIESVIDALNKTNYYNIDILEYEQHSLNNGSNADAVTYIVIKDNNTDNKYFGVGMDASVVTSTIKAIFSCINKIS